MTPGIHPPHRRVVIVRDGALHALRCAEPCQTTGWCMDMDGTPGCYIGGSMCAEGAKAMAARAGYEVVKP